MTEQRPTVETYDRYSNNGRYIRKATRVVFPDGQVVDFEERMPKGHAIRQAIAFLAR